MTTATLDHDLTTEIRGVELVAVGTWDASTGRTRITAADLAAMVEAFNNPSADAAPVKIGHDDDRFQDANGNPPSTRDGEPAYGWIENLRLNDEYTRKDGTVVKAGTVLVGDFVGVPTKLAEIMHTALRRRSVELTRHDRVGGKTYAAVLNAVSLLGVQAPAVKGLKDLRDLFADQLATAQPERFSLEISDDTPSVPQSAAGKPDRDPQTTSTTDSPQTGAVAMAMKLNPAQRKALGLADDATDEQIQAALKKLGLKFADDADDNTQQVDQPTGQPAASTDPASPTPQAAPAAPAAAPAAEAQAPAAQAPAPAATQAAEQGEPVTATRVAAAAATVGLQVVDKEMFAQLQRDAQAGRAARDEQDRQRRDLLVNTAVREGKIAPTAFAAFRKQADENESGLVTLLAAMPAILPTTPVGHGEQFTGNPGTGEQVNAGAAENAAAAKRARLYEAFAIPAPADAAKG